MKYNESSHHQDSDQMYHLGKLEVSRKTGAARFTQSESDVTVTYEPGLFDGVAKIWDAIDSHSSLFAQPLSDGCPSVDTLARACWSTYEETKRDVIVEVWVSSQGLRQVSRCFRLIGNPDQGFRLHDGAFLFERRSFNTMGILFMLIHAQITGHHNIGGGYQ